MPADACRLCFAPLPHADMCHHSRWLCGLCCHDHCIEDN